jgi:hypothetical protein
MGSRRLGRKRLYSLSKLGQSSSNTSGAGIVDAVVSNTVRREGHKIITEITVDLGTSKATIKAAADVGDAIGVDGGGAAYLARLTPAVNGYITYAEMVCLELPNTNLDIDLNVSSVGTLAYDGDVAGAADHALLIEAGGNWAVGEVDHYSVAHGTAHDIGADNLYLYLTSGVATAATFTQGKYVITLEGYAAPDDK